MKFRATAHGVARVSVSAAVRHHADLVRKGIFTRFVGGVPEMLDLNKLAARLWRLEAMRVDERCGVPEIRWRARRGHWVGGTAMIAFRSVTMRVGVECADLDELVEVLLHELVHCACPLRENHGELFCRRLIATAAEAFGIPVDVADLLALDRGPYSNRAYAIDEVLQRQMREYDVAEILLADASLRYAPPPAETPEERDARMAAARAKRSGEAFEHAEEMFRRWDAEVVERERSAKAARQLRAKWKKKLDGFTRREALAAKRAE